MVHRQGLALVGEHRHQVIQTDGQQADDILFEQIAVGADGIALGRKLQIGRYIYQFDLRRVLFQLPAQCDAVEPGHIHIQKCQLIQFQIWHLQGLFPAGADRCLHLKAAGFEIILRISGDLFAKHRVVIADENVHAGTPFCQKRLPLNR